MPCWSSLTKGLLMRPLISTVTLLACGSRSSIFVNSCAMPESRTSTTASLCGVKGRRDAVEQRSRSCAPSAVWNRIIAPQHSSSGYFSIVHDAGAFVLIRCGGNKQKPPRRGEVDDQSQSSQLPPHAVRGAMIMLRIMMERCMTEGIIGESQRNATAPTNCKFS